MGKDSPYWLPQAREFCRTAGINIMGWGPDMLTVEAKSDERAKAIAAQLGQLGFKALENEDDAYAGMLNLSLHPEAIHEKIASFDISRRRWVEQVEPLIWALGSLMLIPNLFGESTRSPQWLNQGIGFFSLVAFFWDGARVWGWRLELLPDALRVRQYFRWSAFPWDQIHTIDAVQPTGKNQESVILKLSPYASDSPSSSNVRLGTFERAFARNLRDRLRIELAKRRSAP